MQLLRGRDVGGRHAAPSPDRQLLQWILEVGEKNQPTTLEDIMSSVSVSAWGSVAGLCDEGQSLSICSRTPRAISRGGELCL
jgi:hypothetical protein